MGNWKAKIVLAITVLPCYILYMNNTQIADYKSYNGSMQKSMLDKIFFLDKIPATDCFVDFGCADGEMLRTIQQYSPNAKLIGYDNDCKMIEIAKSASNKGINYTCKWDKIKKTENSTLILSSVLHEVLHYCNQNEKLDFWSKVFNSGFKYITIRDMVPSQTIDRPADMNDALKVYRKGGFNAIREMFEGIWGSIKNNKALIHFLLKYTYLYNWDREVRENYMPLTHEALMSMIPDNYEIVYHEHYVLPYLKWQVKRDFDIDIKDNTHLKLILRRK